MTSPKSPSRTKVGTIAIRAANTTQDMEECFRIREEVFIVEQRVPPDLERDDQDSDAVHFIALANGRSVGTARAVLRDNGGSAKIGRVAVCRPDRGLGIGKLLMAAIESDPDLTHVHDFLLDAQTHALQFYMRLGYEPYGEEFMDAGIPHRHMKKRKPTGDDRVERSFMTPPKSPSRTPSSTASATTIVSSLLTVQTPGRGFTDLTSEIAKFVADAGATEGAVTLFIRHTSASLTIQENADPTVLVDLTTALDRLAPENAGWRHDTEGPDDMPAHVKTMLTATSLQIPVLKATLALGTWQAIYLIEHRARPHRREIVLQFIGATD
jgi:secondary thiamine-phosphate synthase enzyme